MEEKEEQNFTGEISFNIEIIKKNNDAAPSENLIIQRVWNNLEEGDFLILLNDEMIYGIANSIEAIPVIVEDKLNDFIEAEDKRGGSYSPKFVIKQLKKIGFIEHSQKGSHVHLVKEGNFYKGKVTVPVSKGIIKKGTLHSILKQADISLEALIK